MIRAAALALLAAGPAVADCTADLEALAAVMPKLAIFAPFVASPSDAWCRLDRSGLLPDALEGRLFWRVTEGETGLVVDLLLDPLPHPSDREAAPLEISARLVHDAATGRLTLDPAFIGQGAGQGLTIRAEFVGLDLSSALRAQLSFDEMTFLSAEIALVDDGSFLSAWRLSGDRTGPAERLVTGILTLAAPPDGPLLPAGRDALAAFELALPAPPGALDLLIVAPDGLPLRQTVNGFVYGETSPGFSPEAIARALRIGAIWRPAPD